MLWVGEDSISTAHIRRTAGRKVAAWKRIDLHIHTPASADYQDKDASYIDLLRQAEAKGLDIIAFTDHNTVAGYAAMVREFEQLELLERLGRLSENETERLNEYRRLRSKILVLPGFELTATLGFHILGIFPENTSVRRLEHVLLELHVPEEKLDLGTGEVGATTDVLTAYRIIDEAGGLVIAAHANGSHGVAMGDYNFGGQTKISFTQDKHLHALEVTDLMSRNRRNTAWFFSGVKPEYPRRMICIQGSDAHRLVRDPKDKHQLGIGDRVTEVQLEEVSFAALKRLFESNEFARFRPYQPKDPLDFVKAARKEGPNQTQSFFEQAPAKPGSHAAIVQDVVAFANGEGGTIYLGVSPTARSPVRGVERADDLAAALRGEIEQQVSPGLEAAVEVKRSEDKAIVIVRVPAGPEQPYAVVPCQFYVREGSKTRLATRDEVVALVKRTVEHRAPEPGPVLEAAKESATVAKEGKDHEVKPVAAPTEAAPVLEESALLEAPLPKTGAEIVTIEERGGVRYYTIRDLRNRSTVRNVTRASARHLWHYAIVQHEDQPVKPEDVKWSGEIGLWKVYRRSGTRRFNFVQRDKAGGLHVYYGVTEEALEEPWLSLVPADDAGTPAEEHAEEMIERASAEV